MKQKVKVKVPAKLALSVVAACLVSFCGLITETAVNIAFPAVMRTFDVSTEMVQCYYSQPIWRLSFREVLLGNVIKLR